jgi:hypothetical protein
MFGDPERRLCPLCQRATMIRSSELLTRLVAKGAQMRPLRVGHRLIAGLEALGSWRQKIDKSRPARVCTRRAGGHCRHDE